MDSVKISSKHQIVVPREARERLGLRAGDRLVVDVEGDRIVLEKAPDDPAAALRGLLSGRYGDDPERSLEEERGSWEDGHAS